MRAVVLTAFGGPETLEYREDVPDPAPTEGEVLVRVGAAALNNTDIWTREGAYGLPGNPHAPAGWRGPVSFPRIQGGDVAGTVTEVGPGASAERVGSRVLVDPAIYRGTGWHAPPVGLLGSEADGGFAEYVTVPETHAHDVTGSPLTDEELACLPVAYGTAMGMLERAGLRAGETVLVTGASGGVGLALVQLAAARGAEVLAVTTSSKSDRVREAGAAHVLLRDADRLADRLAGCAPGGLDMVADVVGGEDFEQLMPLLREEGRLVIAGAVAGAVVPFDLRRLYLHNRNLVGSSMHTRRHFDRLVDLARTGSVRPRVAGRYALDGIHEAQREFRAARHVGKIVLVP
ncbi:zinc-binding dehydrogenase [Haloechinothrix sp. YIM 98757]|uniref:Zinc-binding dehydrogenase n=1 Tax=Haloechinothrix aidingensis TaxID=2752311 RepID=A0A838AA52_9PSEU|nr:zinc-binding dehydrogenase [Haloechinothrix aidingensis]MBA0125891.1 zinc-binding dehydrogenase [Haloechinothrix aidingensis]